MEVVLQTVEGSRIDVLVEKADRASFEVVVLGLVILHHKLELLAFLVIFELLFGINILILEGEVLILEIFKNFDTGFKVDWGLIVAIANNSFAVFFKPSIIFGHPVVLDELTRSLVQWVLVIFGVVIVV